MNYRSVRAGETEITSGYVVRKTPVLSDVKDIDLEVSTSTSLTFRLCINDMVSAPKEVSGFIDG